jgi:hypothetical protein
MLLDILEDQIGIFTMESGCHPPFVKAEHVLTWY